MVTSNTAEIVDKTTKKVVLEVPLEFTKPPGAAYANQLIVQADSEVVYLHFFQAQPPFISEEQLTQGGEAVKDLKVQANAVGSIAVPRSKFAAFAGALNQHMEKMNREGSAQDTSGQDSSSRRPAN
jgi:hypothetical protein